MTPFRSKAPRPVPRQAVARTGRSCRDRRAPVQGGTARLRQLAQTAEIRTSDDSIRLHLDTHHAPLPVLDHHVDLMPVLVAEMQNLEPFPSPAYKFRQLGDCVARVSGLDTLPFPIPISHGPDVLRASQVWHAVQCSDGGGHLGRTTPVRAGAQSVADHG